MTIHTLHPTHTPNEEPEITPQMDAERQLYRTAQEVITLAYYINKDHLPTDTYREVMLMITALMDLADEIKPKSKWGLTFNRFRRNI